MSSARRSILVALTGGIGAGKSSVAAHFADLGAAVVDADQIAREIVEPGTAALAEIVARFGVQFVDDCGALRRRDLAGVVFSDPGALADLNAITHHRIAARSVEVIASRRALGGVVVHDLPLLTQIGGGLDYDFVVVVVAPDSDRIDRLVARGLTRQDAVARMAAQGTQEALVALADFVVDNSGVPAQTREQVERVWVALSRSTCVGGNRAMTK